MWVIQAFVIGLLLMIPFGIICEVSGGVLKGVGVIISFIIKAVFGIACILGTLWVLSCLIDGKLPVF